MPSHETILLGILAPAVQGLRNQPLEVIMTYVQHNEKTQAVLASRSSQTPLGGPGQATESPLNLSFLIYSRVSQQWHHGHLAPGNSLLLKVFLRLAGCFGATLASTQLRQPEVSPDMAKCSLGNILP